MANGDQDQIEDAIQRKYDELIADGSFLAASTLQTMELDTVGLTQPLEEGQMLQWNGEGISGQWVNVQPEASLEKIFIDGKEYLLVDNSGPEQMDPIKLQEEITDLHKELDEAYSRLESLMSTEHPVGTTKNPVNSIEEAEKVAETLLGTFQNTVSGMADGGIPFGPYGGGSYVGLPNFSNTYAPTYGKSIGTPAVAFDLSDISLVTEPTSEECKLVSQEDADYERAMSMIGK